MTWIGRIAKKSIQRRGECAFRILEDSESSPEQCASLYSLASAFFLQWSYVQGDMTIAAPKTQRKPMETNHQS